MVVPWPFFVHGVLCLVKPVNARVLSLLNSVKYDSSLISVPLGRSTVFFICELIFLCSYSFQFFFFFDFFFAYAVTVSNFSELFIYAATVFLPELILQKYSVEGYLPAWLRWLPVVFLVFCQGHFDAFWPSGSRVQGGLLAVFTQLKKDTVNCSGSTLPKLSSQEYRVRRFTCPLALLFLYRMRGKPNSCEVPRGGVSLLVSRFCFNSHDGFMYRSLLAVHCTRARDEEVVDLVFRRCRASHGQPHCLPKFLGA